jgi:hypothetical protein
MGVAQILPSLVELGSLIIVSCFYDKDVKRYILFGRTPEQPYRYFMRRFDGKSDWTAWQLIELDIGVKTVTMVKKDGRLYLFWTDLAVDHEADRIGKAASPSIAPEDNQRKETIPVSAFYARMEPAGTWSSPQRLFFYNLLTVRRGQAWLKPFELSDTLYVTVPFDPGNPERIQLTHASFVCDPFSYRNRWGVIMLTRMYRQAISTKSTIKS